MRSGADGEGGRAVSEWEAAEAHLPQVAPCSSPRPPQPPRSPAAPSPPRFARTPHLRASLRTPSPSRPRPFPLHNLIPTPSPTEPRASFSCLPAEPSRLCPLLDCALALGAPTRGHPLWARGHYSPHKLQPLRRSPNVTPEPETLRPPYGLPSLPPPPPPRRGPPHVTGEGRATGPRSRSGHFPGG